MNEPVSGQVLVSNRIPNAYVVCVLQHTLCRSQQRSVCLSNRRPGTQAGVPNLIFFVILRLPFESFILLPLRRRSSPSSFSLFGVSRFIGESPPRLVCCRLSEESRAPCCLFRVASRRASEHWVLS